MVTRFRIFERMTEPNLGKFYIMRKRFGFWVPWYRTIYDLDGSGSKEVRFFASSKEAVIAFYAAKTKTTPAEDVCVYEDAIPNSYWK